MANHKSAKKRAKQNIKKRTNARWQKSRVRTAIKQLKAAVEANNTESAQGLLVKVQSFLGKLSKKSTLDKNTAARLTSRYAKKVNSLNA